MDLDRSTKVKFMTALEYKAISAGSDHTYFGGPTMRGRPVLWCRLIPSGRWWWRRVVMEHPLT